MELQAYSFVVFLISCNGFGISRFGLCYLDISSLLSILIYYEAPEELRNKNLEEYA